MSKLRRSGLAAVADGAVICTRRPRNSYPEGGEPALKVPTIVTSPPLGVVTAVSTTLVGPEPEVVTVPPGGATSTTISSAKVNCPGWISRPSPGNPPTMFTAGALVGEMQNSIPRSVGDEVFPTGGVAGRPRPSRRPGRCR